MSVARYDEPVRFPLLLLLMLATLGACPPPAKPCDSTNCVGCCDASGQCQPGSGATSCGSAGAQCSACSGGNTCQLNVCLPSGGMGGGTGGGAVGGGGGTVQTGTFTVSGHVTYDFVRATYDVPTDMGTLDFANATQRPVRNGVARVVEGTTVLATTNTAADGAYSLTFTATGAGPLSVQVLAKTSRPAVTVQDNTSANAVWAMGAAVPTGGGTLDLRATHGWTGMAFDPLQRKAGPFAILDSMYTAASAFLTARPTLQLPLLKVNWSPNNTTDSNGTIEQGFIGTSYFDASVNEIYVVGKDGVDLDEFDNHVIVHEWGHYFESNVSRSDSLGGDHTSGDVLDPRDAFSEGWGNAASGMLLNDPVYVDTYFTGTRIDAFGWDLENEPTPTDDTSPGPFSETSVMRFIYDAWDTTNEAGFDGVATGLGPIADAFTTGHRTNDALTTIASLVTALKAQPGVTAASVDTLLAHWNIGPLTSAFGDGDATLRAMFENVTTLPRNQSVMLDGRVGFNFAAQNRYWVLTGNGARITVTGNSVEDVSIGAYRRGFEVGFADNGTTGPETFSFNSTAGTLYVITLTGYGALNGSYSATMAITSP